MNSNDINLHFDFGFTHVDETELDVYKELKATAAENDDAAIDAERKLNNLHRAILPLLANLKSAPEKDYILWPDRVQKIEEFESIINKIIA